MEIMSVDFVIITKNLRNFINSLKVNNFSPGKLILSPFKNKFIIL